MTKVGRYRKDGAVASGSVVEGISSPQYAPIDGIHGAVLLNHWAAVFNCATAREWHQVQRGIITLLIPPRCDGIRQGQDNPLRGSVGNILHR